MAKEKEQIDKLKFEKEKAAQASAANEELQQMIAIMKGKIKQMAEQGQREEALVILLQVRALAPNDLELAQMEENLK